MVVSSLEIVRPLKRKLSIETLPEHFNQKNLRQSELNIPQQGLHVLLYCMRGSQNELLPETFEGVVFFRFLRKQDMEKFQLKRKSVAYLFIFIYFSLKEWFHNTFQKLEKISNFQLLCNSFVKPRIGLGIVQKIDVSRINWVSENDQQLDGNTFVSFRFFLFEKVKCITVR